MRRHSAYERTAQSLLALLVGVMLLLGWLAYDHDGMRLAAEIRIESPPDQVWEFLVQPAKRTSWHSGVLSVLPLGTGKAVSGSRSLVLYRDGGPTLELEEEIVELISPTLWRLRQESEKFGSEIIVTLNATGQASLVTYNETKLLRDYTDRYLAPWLRWRGQRRLDLSMDRLKLLAEREMAQTTPAIPR